MKIIKIHFQSVEDFRNRIARLWQIQKDDEEYDFTFEDEKTENAFNDLIKKFN